MDPKYKKVIVPWHKSSFFDGSVFDRPTLATELPTHQMNQQTIKTLSPVISLSDVLERGGLSQYANLFSPQLFGSLNLFPIFRSNLANDLEFMPFGIYQNLIDHVLVRIHPDKTIQSMTMITRDEALNEIGEWLVEDANSSHSQMPPGTVALIYQFGNGFIRASGNFVTEHAGPDRDTNRIEAAFRSIESGAQFQNLLMQVKYLSGRINYTETEHATLAQWVQATDRTQDLFEFFQNRILPYKETSQERFKDSQLFQVLTTPTAKP